MDFNNKTEKELIEYLNEEYRLFVKNILFHKENPTGKNNIHNSLNWYDNCIKDKDYESLYNGLVQDQVKMMDADIYPQISTAINNIVNAGKELYKNYCGNKYEIVQVFDDNSELLLKYTKDIDNAKVEANNAQNEFDNDDLPFSNDFKSIQVRDIKTGNVLFDTIKGEVLSTDKIKTELNKTKSNDLKYNPSVFDINYKKSNGR